MAELTKKLTPLIQNTDAGPVQIMPETYAQQVLINPDSENKVNAQKFLTDLQADLASLHTAFNTFLTGEPDQDDVVNRLSELVALIQANKDTIDEITAGYVKTEDVIDNITSFDTDKPLSANQGRELKGLIDTAQAKANKREAAYVTIGPEDPGFEAAIAALNLADGAIVTVIK